MAQGINRDVLVKALRPFGTTIFSEMTALAEAHHAVNLSQGFPDFDGPEEVVNGGLKVQDTYMSRDEMEALHMKVIEEGQVSRVLRRFRRRNGSLGWLETTIKTRRGAAAAVIGFEGIFRDVTDSFG